MVYIKYIETKWMMKIAQRIAGSTWNYIVKFLLYTLHIILFESTLW